MGNDKTNMFVAIGLSLLVLLGWQYFFAGPRMEQQRQAAAQNQAAQGQTAQQSPGVTPDGIPSPAPKEGGPGAPVPGTVPNQTGPESREAALARSARIRIETPALTGSIALKGGRIDDVSLKNYHETVSDKSPEIVLFAPSGTATPYYAEFGWVGANAGPLPTAETVWTADGQTLSPGMPVTLTWDNGAGLLFKRILAVDAKFMFTVRDEVENKGSGAVTLYPYSLVSRWGKPTTQGYYVLHEGLIGALGADGLQEYTYDHLAKEPAYGGPATKGKAWANVTGGFVGITDKYWAAAAIPDQAMSYTGAFTERTDGATKVYQASVRGDARPLEPGAAITSTQRLFAGAKEVNVINGYEKELGIKQFDLMIDWGWFHFITKPMFRALDFFYHLLGNFGVSILVVTAALKLLFLPIANRSYVSMAKMKAVQPEMTAIRERYKDDKMKQQQAMMELYKKEKINPVAGCWPVLVQIPVFFALYKVLFITIEMRHAPFFGWIQDLAAPDPTSLLNLFGLLPFAAPDFVHLGIWPLIMGVTMFVQMKMNPTPPDPVQAQIFTFMPIIFTFMLGSFPAGLVIYWAWNNTLSVIQQYVIMRRNGVKVELWDNLRGTFRKDAAKTNPAKS